MGKNIFCSECGEPMSVYDKVCPVCKTPNDSYSRPSAQEPLKSNSTENSLGNGNNIMGDAIGKKIEAGSMTETNDNHIETHTDNSVSNTVNSSSVDNSQKVINNSNVTYNIVYQPGMPLPQGMPFAPQAPAQAPMGGNNSAGENALPDANNQKNNQSSRDFEPGAKGAINYNADNRENSYSAKQKSSKSTIAIIGGLIAAVVIVLIIYISNLKKEDATVETPNLKVETTTPQEPVVSKPKQSEPVKTVSKPQSNTPKASAEQKAVSTPTPVKSVKTDANYDEGMKAFEAKDGVVALQKFEESGSAESLYMIGLIYETGCGNISKNPFKARKYFKQAADMGSSKAKAKL